MTTKTKKADEVVKDIRSQMTDTFKGLEARERALAEREDALRAKEAAFIRKSSAHEDEIALRDGTLHQRSLDLDKQTSRMRDWEAQVKAHVEERSAENVRAAAEVEESIKIAQKLGEQLKEREAAVVNNETRLANWEAKLKAAVERFKGDMAL